MKAFPPNPKKQVKLPTNIVAGRERSQQLSPTQPGAVRKHSKAGFLPELTPLSVEDEQRCGGGDGCPAL